MSGLIVRGLMVAIKDRAILGGIDLDVAPGEIVGLIGPNGAGKTTALRAILGLVSASAAKVEAAGKDVRAMSANERAKALAYLPQAREVYWPITAHTLVALGRHPHGDAHAPTGEAVVARSLAEADAAQFAARDVRTLSGGELARVLFARALAVEAPVLLADEPVAALDPGHQLRAMEHLARAAKASCVLVVMHDLSLAARFCQRIYLLDRGRIAASGAARDVVASPALEAAFGVGFVRTMADDLTLVTPVTRASH
jgi:iron complex transport system ATP-binding protein